MPLNEKKLRERFLTIEVALNVLVKEVAQAKKELSELPQPSKRKNLMNERIEQAWLKREKAEMNYHQKKLQNQYL